MFYNLDAIHLVHYSLNRNKRDNKNINIPKKKYFENYLWVKNRGKYNNLCATCFYRCNTDVLSYKHDEDAWVKCAHTYSYIFNKMQQL